MNELNILSSKNYKNNIDDENSIHETNVEPNSLMLKETKAEFTKNFCVKNIDDKSEPNTSLMNKKFKFTKNFGQLLSNKHKHYIDLLNPSNYLCNEFDMNHINSNKTDFNYSKIYKNDDNNCKMLNNDKQNIHGNSYSFIVSEANSTPGINTSLEKQSNNSFIFKELNRKFLEYNHNNKDKSIKKYDKFDTTANPNDTNANNLSIDNLTFLGLSEKQNKILNNNPPVATAPLIIEENRNDCNIINVYITNSYNNGIHDNMDIKISSTNSIVLNNDCIINNESKFNDECKKKNNNLISTDPTTGPFIECLENFQKYKIKKSFNNLSKRKNNTINSMMKTDMESNKIIHDNTIEIDDNGNYDNNSNINNICNIYSKNSNIFNNNNENRVDNADLINCDDYSKSNIINIISNNNINGNISSLINYFISKNSDLDNNINSNNSSKLNDNIISDEIDKILDEVSDIVTKDNLSLPRKLFLDTIKVHQNKIL